MVCTVVLICIGLLGIGYRLYGTFLARQLQLDDKKITPACALNDGIDYVPAKAPLLLGQHFSAIAAAGPIVGPVFAAVWFGWIPALLWIVLGSILVGGVHDMGALWMSIRHKGVSIGEIVSIHMSKTARILFLLFILFALNYVVIAFTDITAQTFQTITEKVAYGPAVAASSVLYLVISLLMGIVLYRVRMPLKWATCIFLPLVLVVIGIGPRLPQGVLEVFAHIGVKQWNVFLLGYCLVASVVPMWLLLQPRGYLGGWLLYLTIGIGFFGAVFGGYGITYPGFQISGLHSLVNGKALFPLLFITIACGACSGFHGIVSSGTTSKQLMKEPDVKIIGYGGMVLEGIVAILAVATVMMLAPGSSLLSKDPNLIYAHGLAQYLGKIGVGFSLAFPFALLAFSTFVYDTLDVCARLSRYVIEELFPVKGYLGKIIAAIAALIVPCIFLMTTKARAYVVAWPIFGASNQLLASLTLLVISVYLRQLGKKSWFTVIPMVFMFLVTVWSLIGMVMPAWVALCTCKSGRVNPETVISCICGSILLILAFWMADEAIRVLKVKIKK